MNNSENPLHFSEEDLLIQEKALEEHHLVLFNDDVNTFDHVIESLMDICDHDLVQAEQCALIVHYNGKCTARNGSFLSLKPMCEALLDRGLSAGIE
ncbi:MAG TPA: ATP-dependent Clp protease adaptor ClpS [Bacteroidia bacterium]|nr:ATP-dependent Clp protease adaptor ClpS [Bacteroidia bacterium]HNT81046.1 ATP-dependent Clp protease adaptor ClpS [Bacteroidia bacterium]